MKKNKEQLTAALLREALLYEPDAGTFTRRVRASSNANVGDLAGCKASHGYVLIRVLGRSYLAHRLAWLYVHGAWPDMQIDHIDGNRSNNILSNLRDVTRSINMQNQRRAPRNSTSGLLGVTRNRNRWMAQIVINGESRFLGSFGTAELAHAAYINAKRLIHPGGML